MENGTSENWVPGAALLLEKLFEVLESESAQLRDGQVRWRGFPRDGLRLRAGRQTADCHNEGVD